MVKGFVELKIVECKMGSKKTRGSLWLFFMALIFVSFSTPSSWAAVEHCGHLAQPDAFDASISSGTRVFCMSFIDAYVHQNLANDQALLQGGKELQILLYSPELLAQSTSQNLPYLRVLRYQAGQSHSVGILTYGQAVETLIHLNDYNIGLKRAIMTGLEQYGFWPRGWSIPAMMSTYIFHDVIFSVLGHFQALRLPTVIRAFSALLAEDSAASSQRIRINPNERGLLTRLRRNWWDKFMHRVTPTTIVNWTEMRQVPAELPSVQNVGEARNGLRAAWATFLERNFGRVSAFMNRASTPGSNTSAFIKLGTLTLLMNLLYTRFYTGSRDVFNDMAFLRNYRNRYANRLDGLFASLPDCVANSQSCDLLDRRILIVDRVSGLPLTQDGRNVGQGARDESAAHFLTVLRDMFRVSDHGPAHPPTPTPTAAATPAPEPTAPATASADTRPEIVRQPLRLAGYEEFSGALNALFRDACDTFDFANEADVQTHCARTASRDDVGFRWTSVGLRTSFGRGGLR